MQIKTILKFYLIPVRMAKSKKSGDNSLCQGCGEKGTLFHCGNYKLLKSPWNPGWSFFRKLNIVFTTWACSTMFRAALFITDRSWKEPRCPSKEEQIDIMWYIYTMVWYAAIKKNDFMKFIRKWMKLENIILSDITKTQINAHSMPSLVSEY